MAELLGFKIFDSTKEDYINRVLEKIKNNEKLVITSGNPEILYTALRNKSIAEVCCDSDIIPDGIGVVMAGKLIKQPFREKIAGIEVMEEIIKASKANNIGIYMLGAEEAVVKSAVEKVIRDYGANVKGYHNGFFDLHNCGDIIEDINKSEADVVFVAMGCPRQEQFIGMYKDDINAKVFMGVGGSFDVLAGKVNRAPKWMIRLGLEWLYRVLKEPWRIKRLGSIPRFLIRVLVFKKN